VLFGLLWVLQLLMSSVILMLACSPLLYVVAVVVVAVLLSLGRCLFRYRYCCCFRTDTAACACGLVPSLQHPTHPYAKDPTRLRMLPLHIGCCREAVGSRLSPRGGRNEASWHPRTDACVSVPTFHWRSFRSRVGTERSPPKICWLLTQVRPSRRTVKSASRTWY